MSSEVIVGNCDKCKVVRAMFKCSGCSGVRYCSKECQREDWKSSHRHVCKELSSIALKWKEQRNFVRFVDGNIGNYMASNLCYVDILDALQHVNDWAVDWDMELTEAERAIVVDPCNRSSLLASYAYHQYQKTRPTTWNPQVDGVEVFAISEEGSEFCRMYSSAMTGPLKNVTLVALNVPWSIPMAIDSQGAPKHAVNAGEAAHAVEGFMLLLHCRAAQGIPVKENQMLEMQERHPPEGYLTIRPSPGDEAKLRQDLCIQMSEAFEQAEALGNAKILVMLPLIGNQEGKHSYDHLLPVVSDLINCPIADNGLAGSDLGGGSSRRFKHKENVDQVSAPEL